MSSATPHRIDPPNSVTPQVGGPHVGAGSALVATTNRVTHSAVAPDVETTGPPSPGPLSPGPDSGHQETGEGVTGREDWLRLHACELVDRLQSWADDLDAREAKLNARSSLQDLRERRFRLEQQNAETELAEQQRSTDRLRREVEADARRLAFRCDSRDI